MLFPTDYSNIVVGSQTIPYTDARFLYLGRWNDSGTGKWTGWPSPEICFTVSGVTYIDVLCGVIDANSTDSAALWYVIDNAPNEINTSLGTGVASIFTGTIVLRVPIPDTGTHTVTLKPVGYGYSAGYAGSCQCEFKGLLLAGNGILTAWAQGSVLVQVVGDSWASAYNGWTRLIDRAHFKYDCVAIPGYTLSSIKPLYKYNYSGVVNTSDPTYAAIVLMFGVNEYNASVSTSTYQANMLALIDEIRLRQPTAKIVMVIEPDNVLAGKLYSQYSSVINTITGLRSNTYACNLSSIQVSVQNYWLADGTGGHLDYRGKPIAAAFVDSYLKATLGA